MIDNRGKPIVLLCSDHKQRILDVEALQAFDMSVIRTVSPSECRACLDDAGRRICERCETPIVGRGRAVIWQVNGEPRGEMWLCDTCGDAFNADLQPATPAEEGSRDA